jgi:antitoxin VapB
MVQRAKLFMNGRSQAVRLPAAFRFTGTEVFIRRDEDTGDVILSTRPPTLDAFFRILQTADTPEDFLDEHERRQPEQNRDPFAGWQE